MIERFKIGWQQVSPAIRLTVAYMVIVMMISLFFSISMYQLSANQLGDSLQRQYNRFNSSPLFYSPNSGGIQVDDEVSEGLKKLKVRLFYFNILILGAGGAASYWLAKRTLRPIEEALESQGRFTADASHELRTPLTAMQTEIEVALRNKKLSQAEALTLLKSNLEEVGKLRQLSEGLLQLANGSSAELSSEPVALDDVVGDALRRVRSAADDRHINIVNKSNPTTVTGDLHTLTELATILIDNAVKYSPPDTTVTVHTRTRGGQGILEVADTGQGIKASDLPHIFDRFYRSDRSRSKEQIQGYGLGLSIAKQIADLHGGYIQVSSTLGRGSVFSVFIPLAGGKHRFKRQ